MAAARLRADSASAAASSNRPAARAIRARKASAVPCGHGPAGYFEHNAHRMCYAHYRKLGMFVGSGAVEAGCKAIVAQRCKLSGMRWTLAGAYGILTLRCLDASDRWEETWAHTGQTGAGAA